MGDLYEELKRKFGDRESADTLSTVDMMSLPTPVRRVIRILLRKNEMTYSDLRRTLDQLPAEQRIRQEEMDEALDALCKLGWIRQMESATNVTYCISLGRRWSAFAPQATSPARRERPTGPLLDKLIASEPETPHPQATKPEGTRSEAPQAAIIPPEAPTTEVSKPMETRPEPAQVSQTNACKLQDTQSQQTKPETAPAKVAEPQVAQLKTPPDQQEALSEQSQEARRRGAFRTWAERLLRRGAKDTMQGQTEE